MTESVRAGDFEDFRAAARGLVARSVAPGAVAWNDARFAQASLFALDASPAPPHDGPMPRVSRRYVELAELGALYRSADRFDLLYRVLYRLTHGEAALMDDELDRDVRELTLRVQSVRRDEHRMHAFVRFRETTLEGEPTFIAWYEPAHFIVPLAAPFFARRFAAMRWSILTPDDCVFWDGASLRFGPGSTEGRAPQDDQLEELFRTYYAATTNPARHNTRLFDQHVPRAFRRNMPELSAVPMVREARPVAPTDSAAHVPEARDLGPLAAAARACTACPLAGPATQTVFGEGPSDARIMLVGEQPGDQEDLGGRPFIGPAGQLLDGALVAAGLPRAALYVTNAVKHFGYRPMGNKKRLHQKPEWRHIEACRPWLRAELETVRPRVIVCLGATAAQSFFGRRFTLRMNRGRVFRAPWADAVVVTHHPSALLRMDDVARAGAFDELVHDLQTAAALGAGRDSTGCA